jgi:hypothetical protein
MPVESRRALLVASTGGGTLGHLPKESRVELPGRTARAATEIEPLRKAVRFRSMDALPKRTARFAVEGNGTECQSSGKSRGELPVSTARVATEIESPGKSVRCRSQDDAGVSAMGPAKRMRMDPFSEDFVAADPMEQVPPEWHSPSVLVNGKSLMSPQMLANRVLPAEM